MPALFTKIRAQGPNHNVTKHGTVAGLPQGNWILPWFSAITTKTCHGVLGHIAFRLQA